MDRAVAPVAIALGSNLGDRLAHLQFAINRLRATVSDLRPSVFRETVPIGTGPQPLFLNSVVAGVTALDPSALLEELLAIERERGRERPWPGAPRTLDLDLILHGGVVMTTDRLTIPHPRFRERRFVLEPLAEIAPDLVDPVTGQTMEQLWRTMKSVEIAAGGAR